MMDKNVYLQEAFKALDILNEEDFNLSSMDDLKDAKEFIDTEEESDFVDIIDPEAETEEELKDSYVGDVILDCTVCHSKLYKNPEEVHVDEAEGLANMDEECPYCYSTDGYEIIGMVAPYGETEEEETEVEIEEPEEEVEVEETEEISEGIFNKKKKQQVQSKNDDSVDPKKMFKLVNVDGFKGVFVDGNKKQLASFKNKDEMLEIGQMLVGKGYKPAGGGAIAYFGESLKCKDKKCRKSMDEGKKKSSEKSSENWGYEIVDENSSFGEGFSEVGFKSSDEAGEAARRNLNDGEKYRVFRESLKDSGKKCRKGMREHFEKVEIETDTEKMEMTSDPNGKTVITTEPKENGEEVIAPVSDEIQSEINPINDEVEDEEEFDFEDEEEMPAEGEDEEGYEDIDVDDFSEEDFDELGESYLRRVYENVNSFKTSSVKSAGNRLIIEGVIGFNSGKQKKTAFVFESKDINRKGKVRFIGENLQLSRGKKAFTMTGKVNGGKFIAESLNYNYRAKDAQGRSTRLYGTIKKSK